jgi:hypothetical protein
MVIFTTEVLCKTYFQMISKSKIKQHTYFLKCVLTVAGVGYWLIWSLQVSCYLSPPCRPIVFCLGEQRAKRSKRLWWVPVPRGGRVLVHSYAEPGRSLGAPLLPPSRFLFISPSLLYPALPVCSCHSSAKV